MDQYNDYFKEVHEKLNIVGECKQCGLCCREAWRFEYACSLGHSLKPIYKTKQDRSLCQSFDSDTNKCKVHNKDKPSVCKYWPLLETDLDQIDCPGFKIIKE